MPPKTIQDSSVYYSVGDGEYHKLGSSIPSIEMSDTEKIRGDSINTNRNDEITFTLSYSNPVNGLTFNELWMILSGVCMEWQITSNNWRRLHNIPMKKRKKK